MRAIYKSEFKILRKMLRSDMGNGSATGHFALEDYKFGSQEEKLLTFHFGIIICI